MITLFCISICWIGLWRVPRSALRLPVQINKAACASGVHCPVTILQSYLLNCAKIAIQTCWRQWFAGTSLVSWIDPWLLWKPRINCFSSHPHQIYKSLPYNRDVSLQDRIPAQPNSSDPKSTRAYKCFWLCITCRVMNSLLFVLNVLPLPLSSVTGWTSTIRSAGKWLEQSWRGKADMKPLGGSWGRQSLWPEFSSTSTVWGVQHIRTAPCSHHLRLPGPRHRCEHVLQKAFGNQEGISCSVSHPTTRVGNVGLRRVTVWTSVLGGGVERRKQTK